MDHRIGPSTRVTPLHDRAKCPGCRTFPVLIRRAVGSPEYWPLRDAWKSHLCTTHGISEAPALITIRGECDGE